MQQESDQSKGFCFGRTFGELELQINNSPRQLISKISKKKIEIQMHMVFWARANTFQNSISDLFQSDSHSRACAGGHVHNINLPT